eukprot:1031729-Pyramimonas_sp.AAC.2
MSSIACVAQNLKGYWRLCVHKVLPVNGRDSLGLALRPSAHGSSAAVNIKAFAVGYANKHDVS